MRGLLRSLPAALALVVACVTPVLAQGSGTLPPVPKECETPGAAMIAGSALPNIATALKERRKITILAIGGTSASLRGPVSGGEYARVKTFLEGAFKGLDVDIVHRGVSGELAQSAAERIKTEVALNSADLVLWQLGTADALAHVPVDEFRETVTLAVQWLKDHEVDVILVGLRYARSMAKHEHYQAIRGAVRDIAKAQNVIRISRYEAEETMARIRREEGRPASEPELSEATYVCMAEHLARAIAAGLFLKPGALGGGRDAPAAPVPPTPPKR